MALYRVELLYHANTDGEAIDMANLMFERAKALLRGMANVELGDVDAMKPGPPEYERCIVRRGKPVAKSDPVLAEEPPF